MKVSDPTDEYPNFADGGIACPIEHLRHVLPTIAKQPAAGHEVFHPGLATGIGRGDWGVLREGAGSSGSHIRGRLAVILLPKHLVDHADHAIRSRDLVEFSFSKAPYIESRRRYVSALCEEYQKFDSCRRG